MRSRPNLLVLAAGALAAVVLVACSSSTGGSAPIAHGSARHGPGPAAREICSPMVRDSVPSTVGLPLINEPVSSIRGDTFSCRYAFDGGDLDLSVRDLHTLRQAHGYFRGLRHGQGVKDALPGVAAGGFSKQGGSVVAMKDAMVLTVDVAALPPTTADRSGIAVDVAATVLGCWTADS